MSTHYSNGGNIMSNMLSSVVLYKKDGKTEYQYYEPLEEDNSDTFMERMFEHFNTHIAPDMDKDCDIVWIGTCLPIIKRENGMYLFR